MALFRIAHYQLVKSVFRQVMLHKLTHLQMKLAVDRFIASIDHFESMATIPIHMTVAIWSTST